MYTAIAMQKLRYVSGLQIHSYLLQMISSKDDTFAITVGSKKNMEITLLNLMIHFDWLLKIL